MGDDNRRIVRPVQLGDARTDDAQRIDVQTAVRFIENRQLRFEHRHLEDLVLLLLAARETFVHRTGNQFGVQFHDGALLPHQLQKLGRRKRFLTPELALFVHGHLHKVGHRHARNLHRVLKSEEQPHAGTLLDGQRQQILLQEGRLATRDREFLVPGQHRSQRALSRAVRSHDGMHLAGLHLEVDALQYLFSGDLRP